MKIVYKLSSYIVGAIFLLVLMLGYGVFAQEEPNIEFPVAELGNCGSKEECKVYCDEVEHIAQCIDFAESHGLMHGVKLEEAKKVARALQQGAQLPGGCRGKEECEAYCEEPTHTEECLAFAEAAGFMNAEELEDARRVAPLMARGEMPGGCRSREECETYCSQESHVEECVAFFQKAGFMTAEEAEMFRKTGGKGPGECGGREECEAFCNDPANQNACFEFAKEHGLIPEEELEHIEEGLHRFQEGFSNAPPEVAQCLRDTIGAEVLSKIESGTFLPNPQVGEHMRRCFEQFMPASPGPGSPEGFPEGFEGPPPGGEGFVAPPEALQNVPQEAQECVRRIIGNLQGPPGPEIEERIRRECIEPLAEQFQGQLPPPEAFQVPEEFEIPPEFQEPEEFHFEEPPAEQEARVPQQSFLGAVWEAMQPGLRRLISK